MGVEIRGSVYRARIKVGGVRYVGPSRQQLAAAEADQRQLEAARAAGADMEAVIKQLFASMEVDARAARVEECIEKCKDSFRARVKKQGHTYFGPRRIMRSEALEDATTLLAAADISIPALQAAETRLKEESGLPEMSLEKAVLEAMSYWLRQGSTSEMEGVSRALKTRMRRVTKGSEQDVLFDAAKLLVKEHLEMEHFAQQASAEWLWEKGVHLRLDYGSRPRDTSGLQDRFWQTGLRNLGNSCYLNAVVQCMVACQPLRRDLSQRLRKGPLRTCMEELTQRLQSEKYDCIAPYALLNQIYLTNTVKFPPGESADCSDCLEILLETCISDCGLYVSSAEATGRGRRGGGTGCIKLAHCMRDKRHVIF